MPELKALLEAVEQNNKIMEEAVGDIVDLKVEVNNLPSKYLPRSEAQEKAERARNWIVGLLAGGVALVMCVATMLYLNHGVTCGVRGILVSAETASLRNPLPNDLSPEQRKLAEERRIEAGQFYKESLDRLNIIWPCAGETP